MLDDPDQAFAVAAARFLELPLSPGQLAGVAAQLASLRAHAAVIAARPLPDGLDPAPVFVP